MNCLYDGAAAIGSAVAYVLKQPLRLISYFCGRVVAGLSAVKKKTVWHRRGKSAIRH